MFIGTSCQDLPVGLRVVVKENRSCTLAGEVLALRICDITTMFAVITGALIRGLKLPDADRLLDVRFVDPAKFTPDNFSSRFETVARDAAEVVQRRHQLVDPMLALRAE